MIKCNICKFSGEDFDGEAAPDGHGGYTGGGSWVKECAKGQYKYLKIGGEGCKKFKEIMVHCDRCKRLTPVSQINLGFCSDKCKKEFVEYVKKNVIEDMKKLVEMTQDIKKLASDDNIKHDMNKHIELMGMQSSLDYLEHYLEEGKHILSVLDPDYKIEEEK